MRYCILLGMAAAVTILDQLTKWWAMATIPQHRSIVVLEGFFDLVNIRNRGAAFGFLNRSDIEWQFWLFLGATIVATLTIWGLVRSSRHDPLLFTSLGLVLGGAIGNLIDRIRYRAVVDFLDFYVGDWHWPAFNVADIAICVGALGACIAMYRVEKCLHQKRGQG